MFLPLATNAHFRISCKRAMNVKQHTTIIQKIAKKGHLTTFDDLLHPFYH